MCLRSDGFFLYFSFFFIPNTKYFNIRPNSSWGPSSVPLVCHFLRLIPRCSGKITGLEAGEQRFNTGSVSKERDGINVTEGLVPGSPPLASVSLQ